MAITVSVAVTHIYRVRSSGARTGAEIKTAVESAAFTL